jgi:hypothetical protein
LVEKEKSEMNISADTRRKESDTVIARRIRRSARFALLGLVLALTALPVSAKPGISVTDNTNECGGTLVVTGSGFKTGEQVHISISGLSETKGTLKLGTAVGTATGKNGRINIQIPYSLGSDCSFHGGSVLITVHASDSTHQSASGATYIRSCQIIWTACAA